MSDKRDEMTPEFGDYSLAGYLREYARRAGLTTEEPAAPKEEPPAEAATEARAETPSVPDEPAPAPEAAELTAEERSRRIVMDALGETLRQYQSGALTFPSEPQTDPTAAAESVVEYEERPVVTEETTESGDRIVTLLQRRRVDTAETGGAFIPNAEDAGDGDSPDEEPDQMPDWVDQAAQNAARPERSARAAKTAKRPRPAQAGDTEEKPSFQERFLAPAIRLVATRIARRQMQRAEAANWPDPVDIRDTPELTPRKAGKFYTTISSLLKIRFHIAIALCLPLVWLALGLPAVGLLGQSVQLQAGVSLILTLAVMITALDVVATGLRQTLDLHPGIEALAALATLLSCADAVVVLLGQGDYVPFCAIGGVALTAALWGEVLTCRAMRNTLKTSISSKNPSVLTSEADGRGDGTKSLLRSERDTLEGIVRRSEKQDFCQTAYATAAPLLLFGALLLTILASFGGHGYFLHTLSALVSVSASFAAFFTFPLPWSSAARRLRSSGAALIGWEGCADIGQTRRIVITDEDLFPPGTMKFTEINVQEGVFLGKAVASTAALIQASGSGAAALFEELIARRGYHIPPVDEFSVHEGGGLSGIVGGETVLVGSAGFMNLMGIRLPQNLQAKNSICTAISGELVAVFVIDYIPVTSVQDALVTLMRGHTQTVFAIRDFNITPRMISRLFRMPTDNFNFPTFRERYRMSGAAAGADTPISAVITRSGMLPLVEAAEAGRKVHNITRAGTIIDLVGSVIGMLIMFLLCRAGSFDTADVRNVLSFMLLWALPVAILSFGQNRS